MSQNFLQDQCSGFLNTPPLWENREFGIQQFEFPVLDLESFHAQPIPQNIRLGHQMEYVFKQLLDYSSDYEVLLHNLPIKDEKRTLGEIDFILKNLQTQKLIHVELTCKFYIINPEIKTPLQQLIGPNKRDLFFAKMEKIRDQQFPLLHTPEGIKALENHGIAVNKLAHQCCFKAQLYVSYGDKKTNLNPLTKNC